MYKFKMPIGDWSGDGHGKCTYYICESNKTVEEVRDIHFQMKEFFGFTINDFCDEYEESVLDNEEIIEKLKSHGFDFSKFDNEEDVYYLCDDGMVELWIFMLMTIDTDLLIKIIPDNDMPMLPFYGFDKENRHISFVGYGLFD